MNIFVAHPFNSPPLPDYRDAYNAVAVRLRQQQIDVTFEFAEGARQTNAAHILEEIEELVAACDASICDLTGSNSNVMLECGLARGRGKPVTLLLRAPVDEAMVPADVRGLQQRRYSNRAELEREVEFVVRNHRTAGSTKDEMEYAEEVFSGVGIAVDSLRLLLHNQSTAMRLVEITDKTGLDQEIVRVLLNRLLAEEKIYREGEGTGTRYTTWEE